MMAVMQNSVASGSSQQEPLEQDPRENCTEDALDEDEEADESESEDADKDDGQAVPAKRPRLSSTQTNLIREFRKTHSQEAVAQALNVHRSSVKRYQDKHNHRTRHAGRGRNLSVAEEHILIGLISRMNDFHCTVSREQIYNWVKCSMFIRCWTQLMQYTQAREIYNAHHEQPVDLKFFTESWFRRFVKRYPDMKRLKALPTTAKRMPLRRRNLDHPAKSNHYRDIVLRRGPLTCPKVLKHTGIVSSRIWELDILAIVHTHTAAARRGAVFAW